MIALNALAFAAVAAFGPADPRTTRAGVDLVDEKGLAVSSRTVKTPEFAQTPLERKISADHRILVSDRWGGGHRIIFDFNGRKGWIVEPEKAADGSPWVWTMQWMGAFLNRTGAPQLVERGWHHVHLEAFDTRADDEGLKVLAAFQSYLVEGLGFAKKANLIGMSWGGFYSIRYASEYPENVSRIYLDAPLLNVYTLPKNWAKDPTERIGSWAKSVPADPANDSRMAVNRAAAVARAKIPILLLYGKSDDVVDPARNCEPFLRAFRAAGGSVAVEARVDWGHHPHGLGEGEVGRIVDFFSRPD
ncbi:MAG: alpha/beta fold hydrolase [bacterium]|nr:alpha/beta fold hydrolase [Candidatus Colisoma equi]